MKTCLLQSSAGLKLGVVACLVLLAGCGGADGPTRYEVSGQVTYNGQPVPTGRVVFEPTAGNTGPAAYATITAGQYATDFDQGAVPGAHRVRIMAFDGQASGEMPDGRLLLPEYETTVELPASDSTHDFPLSAAN